jgi:tripartite-type tricarboxylate transporter receptor subunit TctC
MKLASIVFLLSCIISGANAQDQYPHRPLRLLVPNAPGGPTDVFARFIAYEATPLLGQNIVVDNRGGAGGMIAMRALAGARPDGYTIALNNVGSVAVNPALHKDAGYVSDKDFMAISMITSIPIMLVVRSDLPVKTVDELVKMMRSKPKAVNFSSPGVGQSTHIGAVLLRSIAGSDTVIVPTRSSAQAQTELLNGTAQAMFATATTLPMIKKGVLKALGVAGKERSPLLPDVPTFNEANLPDLNLTSWYVMQVPAATPKPIVDKLNAAVVQILKRADTRERFAGWNCQPSPTTPEEAQQFVGAELVRWRDAIKRTGVTAE